MKYVLKMWNEDSVGNEVESEEVELDMENHNPIQVDILMNMHVDYLKENGLSFQYWTFWDLVD